VFDMELAARYRFQLRFIGRNRGAEQFAYDDPAYPAGAPQTVTLGWLSCHLDADVKPLAIPEERWPKDLDPRAMTMSKRLRQLCGESRSARDRQRAFDELGQILVQPREARPSRPPNNAYSPVVIVPTIEVGPRHQKPVQVWRALDAEAAATAELLYALLRWEWNVTARDCTICGRAFLRSPAYTGLLCVLCRALNAFQKEQLLDVPEDRRESIAVEVYRARLANVPFTGWSAFKEGKRR
jgi:hypothetical protein